MGLTSRVDDGREFGERGKRVDLFWLPWFRCVAGSGEFGQMVSDDVGVDGDGEDGEGGD